MHSLEARSGNDKLAADQITQYRRDGFVVVRRLLSPRLVDACLAALTDLASGKQTAAQAGVIYEPGQDVTGVAAEARIDHVRKFTDFVEDFPAPQARGDAAQAA